MSDIIGSTIETLNGWAALDRDGHLIDYFESERDASNACRDHASPAVLVPAKDET